ncbi:ankyrin repeat domain-containing protein [Wolbachia endosymbiont of Tetranychus urticae]
MVRFLIDEGVNVNIINKYVSTALHNVAYYGDFKDYQIFARKRR